MAESYRYRELGGSGRRYWALLALLGVPLLLAAVSFFYIESAGLTATGMDNQIVWGTPHVFAVFLLVAATGALNVAMLASVFGQCMYRRLAPLSALVCMALLAAGLAVFMLDMGRPDRIIEAMTHYNFSSIFAPRTLIYSGFLGVVAVYMWFMLERRMNDYIKPIAIVALLGQLFVATAVAETFGLNAGREAYDTMLYVPMFMAFGSAYGTAIFTVFLFAALAWDQESLPDELLRGLRNLLAVSVGAALFFGVLFLFAKNYLPRSQGVARFLLCEGGVYTALLWLGQIALGGIVPLVLLLLKPGFSRSGVVAASVLVILGGLAQMYVTVIGGQAYPQILFPGMTESSTFFDGEIHPYSATLAEILLGLGGMALAAAIVAVTVRSLAVLPVRFQHFGKPRG
jgi:Ni/Fe-hydrogenase subunit HybB-like protein